MDHILDYVFHDKADKAVFEAVIHDSIEPNLRESKLKQTSRNA
ncbi:MAG TPA: hypothetical protein PKA82_10405 [Pyrinomonadaceae bacterium]|nr:hypothetical protein [Pyrinomonadaceae bacterium]